MSFTLDGHATHVNFSHSFHFILNLPQEACAAREAAQRALAAAATKWQAQGVAQALQAWKVC